MERELTEFFSQWGRLGAPALHGNASDLAPEPPESLIAKSTRLCRHSSRLAWMVLGWLTRNPEQLDPKWLVQLTREQGDLSVLGLLCDAARERRPHPVFDEVVQQCSPRPQEEIFFHRVARTRLASSLVRQEPIKLVRRWNLLSNEISYL